ncbi:hypothetical protein DAEQUDRAFT_209253 [Daedalea quercina L-15889]|uniref:Uncharacterized protein n=1 Tax=Daedalea quercina L-15889 TaxID=1314783 RepID=A0A165R9X0_9APHY|nr:hypothetical protein DAEQUDRAFT_209253 [Daedalea quercina L-15889]
MPSTLSNGVFNSPPSTPPRGRQSSRYPASLARGDPGRVPLHRRGTSKTYERLEDLLREAGYKETRIFTPEWERKEARDAESRKGSLRGGVDSVVGYLASWVQGSGKAESSSHDLKVTHPPEPRFHWSLPPSPLAHKRPLEDENGRPRSPLSVSPTASSTTIASSIDSVSGRTVNYRHYVKHAPPQLLRPKTSASSNLRTYAQVSAAQGYLRHMASAPNMPKRGPSTRETSVDRQSVYAMDCGQPALPPRWFESVTKAVAGVGHPHAHVGGPQNARRLSRPSSRDPRARERGGKFTLSGQTNRQMRSASGAPPGLTMCLARAGVAPGEVSTARVMCRSAPASRSSSRVGNRIVPHSARSGHSSGQSGPTTARSEAFSFSSRRQGGSDGVPLLASTCIENDAWSTHWVDGQRVPMMTVSPTSGDESMCSGSEDDDDDDDGELTFARLLVPPKRQYSIQSLRKHLHHSQSRSNLREHENPFDEDEEAFLHGRAVRSPADDEDGESHGWQTLGMPGFKSGTVKRRSGTPGNWANFTARS